MDKGRGMLIGYPNSKGSVFEIILEEEGEGASKSNLVKNGAYMVSPNSGKGVFHVKKDKSTSGHHFDGHSLFGSPGR